MTMTTQPFFADQELVCTQDDNDTVSSLGSYSSFDEDSDSDSISSSDDEEDEEQEAPAHYQRRRTTTPPRRRPRRASNLVGSRTPSAFLCSAPDLEHFNPTVLPRQAARETTPARWNSEFTRSFSDLHVDKTMPSAPTTTTRVRRMVRKTKSVSDDGGDSSKVNDRWAPASMSGRALRLSKAAGEASSSVEDKTNDRWSPASSNSSKDLFAVTGSTSNSHLDHTPRNPRASMSSLLVRDSVVKDSSNGSNARWTTKPTRGRSKSQLTIGLLPESPIRGISRWNSSSSSGFTRAASVLSITSNADWSVQPKLPKRRPRKLTSSSKTTKGTKASSKEVIVTDSDNSSEMKLLEEESPTQEDTCGRVPSLDGIRFPSLDLDAEALAEYDSDYELENNSVSNGDNDQQDQDQQGMEEDKELEKADDFNDLQPLTGYSGCYSTDFCETIMEEDTNEEENLSSPARENDCVLRAPKRRKSECSLVFADECDSVSTAHSGSVRRLEMEKPQPPHPSPRCPKQPTRRASLMMDQSMRSTSTTLVMDQSNHSLTSCGEGSSLSYAHRRFASTDDKSPFVTQEKLHRRTSASSASTTGDRNEKLPLKRQFKQDERHPLAKATGVAFGGCGASSNGVSALSLQPQSEQSLFRINKKHNNAAA